MLTNKLHPLQTMCFIETGLSDYQRMTISALKIYFRKYTRKVISYRDFKKIGNERFMNSLLSLLSMKNILIIVKNLTNILKFCHILLNTYAAKKKKYIRENDKPFMTKAFSKGIMQRARFRNNFLKNPTDQNKLFYNKQRNFCVSLLRKEKKECLKKEKDKVKSRETISLVNNEDIESNEN